MPQTGIVNLNAPPLVPAGPGRGGGCLLVFGLPFIAIGTYLAWLVRFHSDRITFESPRMPNPFLYCFCAAFVGGGLALWAAGIPALIRSWRTKRRMLAHPRELWLGDYHWDPRGDRQRPLPGVLVALISFAWVVAFLAPFHWWMSVDPWPQGFLILGLFDTIFIGIGCFWLLRLARSLRHGAGWVRFDRFPFFLGESLDVRLGCRGRLDRFETLAVTLRCVQLKREQVGGSSQVVAYQHWAERLDLDPSRLQDPKVLPVSVRLPTGDLGTWLSEEPPRYWEIELRGTRPGLDFESRLLVPVYARSGRA